MEQINKRDLITVQQIDGTGIKTPHERELQTIATSVLSYLPNHPAGDVKNAVEKIGGTFHEIGFGEDFTISFQYYPGVRIHMPFFSADEDGSNQAEVKFFFSGDRVALVSSEDLASFADLTMDYLRSMLHEPSNEVEHAGPSDLLQRSILQRSEPFGMLKRNDLSTLAAYIGGTLQAGDLYWYITKEFFKGVNVVIKYDGKKLWVDFTGQEKYAINNHAKDQLAIFTINHALRFIGTTYTALEMPDIVKKAFSFSYIRAI